MKPTKRGYVAIARGIIDHPLFKTNRPLSRLEAWQWLIEAAAWKRSGTRNKFGVMHNERGQLCITRRELAKAWRWTKSKVDRFLERLAAESMVSLGAAQNGPKNGTINGPIPGYARTRITICKYDVYQAAVKAIPGQKAGQKAGQPLPQLPLGIEEYHAETSNQYNHKESGGKKPLPKPRHLSISGDHKWIWCDHGLAEWHHYSRDDVAVNGSARAVEFRLGGGGNWFYRAGASTEPKKKKAYG
jgi:hypothetical protein